MELPDYVWQAISIKCLYGSQFFFFSVYLISLMCLCDFPIIMYSRRGFFDCNVTSSITMFLKYLGWDLNMVVEELFFENELH